MKNVFIVELEKKRSPWIKEEGMGMEWLVIIFWDLVK
jgi:hypothetical protein